MTKWKIKHPLEICFPAHRRKLKILSWENWKNDTLLPMLSKITLASSFCMNTGSCKQGNSWCTLSPKKGLMKRKFSPSLLTVMYNKTKMDSTMDRWWCLELSFFFFTPSLKEVWLKKRAQAKNEFYGALDESCRLRGMPSVPKPSSSVCLESRTGRDGDPTFDFKTSIRG